MGLISFSAATFTLSLKVVHACYLPLSSDHPDFGRLRSHPGRWVLNLAVAQRKYTSIQPELLVQVPGSKQDFSTIIEEIPIHYLATPKRLRSITLFNFDLKSIGRKIRTLGFDVVHAHGLEDAYGLAAQRSGLPHVITAQGLHFQLNRKIRPRVVSRAKVIEFTEWLAFKRGRHIITKSDYVARELKARFPHLILHPIPNTFDERLLEVEKAKRPNSLVFVGTISPHKGVHTLRKALIEVQRANPEVTLDVIGDSTVGAFPYELEEKKLLHAALDDRVVFHGILGVTDLANLVASARALVAPSMEDMFGNQLVEALILKTHGIVAEGTALAENVRRFGNGTIVPQSNPKALADAITKVLTEPPSEVEAQRAREAAVAAFSPAKVAKLHLQIYEELLREEPVL